MNKRLLFLIATALTLAGAVTVPLLTHHGHVDDASSLGAHQLNLAGPNRSIAAPAAAYISEIRAGPDAWVEIQSGIQPRTGEPYTWTGWLLRTPGAERPLPGRPDAPHRPDFHVIPVPTDFLQVGYPVRLVRPDGSIAHAPIANHTIDNKTWQLDPGTATEDTNGNWVRLETTPGLPATAAPMHGYRLNEVAQHPAEYRGLSLELYHWDQEEPQADAPFDEWTIRVNGHTWHPDMSVFTPTPRIILWRIPDLHLAAGDHVELIHSDGTILDAATLAVDAPADGKTWQRVDQDTWTYREATYGRP